MTVEVWRSRYFAPTMGPDIAAEINASGFLDPYDMAYPILQGRVLVIWPMMRQYTTKEEDAPQNAKHDQDGA